MSGGLNVLLYQRGRERYMWIYRDDQVPDVQRSLGRFAAHQDLSFTWQDAARCAIDARQQLTHEKHRRFER